MNNTESHRKRKIKDQKYVDPRIPRDRILTKPAGDSSGNTEFRRVAWPHHAVRKERRIMTITDYIVALGGMLASLGCAGLVAAGFIKARARHQVLPSGCCPPRCGP